MSKGLSKKKIIAKGSRGGSSVAPVVFNGKVHLTSADINNMGVTPIVLVPAQGVGTAIQCIGACVLYNFNTTAPIKQVSTYILEDEFSGTFQYNGFNTLSYGANVFSILSEANVTLDTMATAITENSPLLCFNPYDNNIDITDCSADLYFTYVIRTL